MIQAFQPGNRIMNSLDKQGIADRTDGTIGLIGPTGPTGPIRPIGPIGPIGPISPIHYPQPASESIMRLPWAFQGFDA